MASAKTVGCVLANCEAAFKNIGAEPAFLRAAALLENANGVDRVAVILHPSYHEQWDDSKELEPYEVLATDTICGDESHDFVAWAAGVPTLKGAEILVILRPWFPFIPVGKIEKGINLVKAKKVAAAVTGRVMRSFDMLGSKRATSASVLANYPGCQVLRCGDAAGWAKDFKVIELNTIEGLDIRDSIDESLALSLVCCGTA